MRKALLSLGLVAFLTCGSALAEETTKQDNAAAGTAEKLEMPQIKDRRHMMFQFGLFGTGFHIGWRKPKPKDEVAKGEFRGIGSPILFTSVGHKSFGLGRPRTEKYTVNTNSAEATN